MPHLLSLVGKALGSILRAQGSNDSGRNRSSFDSDNGLYGSKHCSASPAGASPASEPSSRKHSSGQYETLEHLGGTSSQSADLFSAEAADADGVPNARILAAPGSAGGCGTSAPGPVACVGSDVSLSGSASPPAAPQFFRASRASLSDATASAAGEALRQASVTSCKHFSRENYNNYVRWVRASRGALRLAGKFRARPEATCRNPHPALLLRCEHWLEVTDEQHRYGSNLRVYFDYWVAEMEAAELTPPQSPALMSPSPSCPHLVALAQQHQQLQLASAIACAAIPERLSAGSLKSRIPLEQQRQRPELLPAASAQLSSCQLPMQDLNQEEPLPMQQELQEQNQTQHPQQAGSSIDLSPLAAVAAAAAAQAAAVTPAPGPGPGPSRFFSDTNSCPRLSGGQDLLQHQLLPPLPSQLQQEGQQGEIQCELQPQQRTCAESRTPTLSQRRLHHHYHHQVHSISVSVAGPVAAAARARHESRVPVSVGDEDGKGDLDRAPTGRGVLSSLSSRPSDDSQGPEPGPQLLPEQMQVAQQHHPHPHHDNHRQKHALHHRHHIDLELYEREGSVRRGTDDGCGGESLPTSLCATRSHDRDDGEDDGRGRAEPLSPAGSADAAPGPRASVSFVTGSCDPPPSLLQQSLGQRQLQQQRRRSCGESEVPLARHPAAVQPRPSSDAISALVGASTAAGGPSTMLVSQQQQQICGSPRRNVLCSPSKRFMLAAMIDMSATEGQQPNQQVDERQQQEQQRHFAQQGAETRTHAQAPPAQPEGLLSRQLQQEGCGGAAGGGAPPATPQPQGPASSAAPPAMLTPAPTAGGGGGGAPWTGCTAHRAAKMMSNRACVGSGTSFFRWLDYGPGLEVDLARLGVSRAKLDAERVKYLTPEELLEYELDVDMETGLLRYKRSGKLLHTGPDGRGSLDEHRRPPTPPPPAVPLSLLGEGAAALWRSFSATEPPPAPTRGASCSQATDPTPATTATAPLLPVGSAPLGLGRQSVRRVAPMGTVPEGCDGADEPLQSGPAGDAAIDAALAAAVAGEAARDCLGDGTSAGAARTYETAATAAAPVAMKLTSFLPDLELRGHSASSLARLEPSRGECYISKTVTAGGSGSAVESGCGSGGDNSRPCSSTDAGGDALDGAVHVAAAAAALRISAGETGSSSRDGCSRCGDGAVSLTAESRDSDGIVEMGATYERMAAPAAIAKRAATAFHRPPATHGSTPAPQLPDQICGPEWSDQCRHPAAAFAGAAAAGGGAAPGFPVCGTHGAGGIAPRVPGAVAAAHGGGSGVVHHHDEKVAKWIYVVDPELRLFVHPKVRGRFHHSSFLRGGAVVAAGGLAARHGRLRLLTADSGHYWPREENFRWLCEHLVYVGADLSACELRSKHMAVPAATGKELMDKLGVPPPWRMHYPPVASPSGQWPLALPADSDAPPSPLAEHTHLLQLQEVEGDVLPR